MASFWDSLTAPFTGKPIQDAARAQTAALQQGKTELGGLYGQGRDALTQNYTSALQPWTGMQGTAMGGYDAYADASGANGPEGLARARANFSGSPGLDFATQRGIEGLTRAGAATGRGTGNVMRDALEFSHGLGLQDWGNYIQRLAPWLNQATTGAGAMSNIFTGLGQGLNQSFMGQGNQFLGAQGQIGQAQAQGAMAPMIAGGNLWNSLFKVGDIASSFLGGKGSAGTAPVSGGPTFAQTQQNPATWIPGPYG